VSLPPGVTLRTATADDAEAGAELHLACWREAYGPYVDPEILEERLAGHDRWVAAWERQLSVGPPRTLALDGNEPVGFAVAGPSRKDDAPVDLELYALYTRAAWWGSGLGAALLHAVAPNGPCWLFVLEANTRARAFYRRHGFEADGHGQLYQGFGTWEIRMVRADDHFPKKHDRSILVP
jgi:ribosomal protein S18 acetylase RimI-like enzyme